MCRKRHHRRTSRARTGSWLGNFIPMPTPVTLQQRTSSRKSPRPTTLLAMRPSAPSTTRFVVKARWVAWDSVVVAAVAGSTPVPVALTMKAPILAICLVACSAAVGDEVARTKVVVAHRNAVPTSRQHFGCHSVKRSTVWKLRFTSRAICPVEHVAVPVQSQAPRQRCVSTVVEAASPTTTRACSRSHLRVPYAVAPVLSSRPHAEPVAPLVSKSVRAKSRFAFLPALTRVNASS